MISRKNLFLFVFVALEFALACVPVIGWSVMSSASIDEPNKHVYFVQTFGPAIIWKGRPLWQYQTGNGIIWRYTMLDPTEETTTIIATVKR